MKLDQTLAREIKAANGDGSRSAKFALLRRVENARQEMSTPEIRVKFSEILRTHGRAVTAICVASTLWSRQERLESWGLPWAREVLLLWTTKPPSGISRATIDDGIHPTRICEYAAEFIKLTTEH